MTSPWNYLFEADDKLRNLEREWHKKGHSAFAKYARELQRTNTPIDVTEIPFDQLRNYFDYDLNFTVGTKAKLSTWLRDGISNSGRLIATQLRNFVDYLATGVVLPKRRSVVAVGFVGAPRTHQPMADTMCVVYRWLHVPTSGAVLAADRVTAYAGMVTDVNSAAHFEHFAPGIVTINRHIIGGDIWFQPYTPVFTRRTEETDVNRIYTGHVMWLPQKMLP
jgi:hypothetical protein